MNRFGLKRWIGISIALGIFVLGFVLFVLLPYLNMNEQLMIIENKASIYDRNYSNYLREINDLKSYFELLEANSSELNGLHELMSRESLPVIINGNTLRYSGEIPMEKLTRIMNYLSGSRFLKIVSFVFESDSDMPVRIGDEEPLSVRLKNMEIETIETDETVLER